MARILSLFYVLIMFVSLFIVVTDGKYVICQNSSQCPRSNCFPYQNSKCVRERCKCV
uniref:Nodule-specific cysteine-rich peptide L18 n=1 Tax=Lens culinaris TaxID=3864 RepID=A0A7T8IGI9_LENCU|nr:nodule-specific cysteine-rich peptide L18 [Lens culinaris]